MQTADIKAMIADHMEAGFLENIIDMFKHDRTLFPFLSHLMADERVRVRLGAVALVECLREAYQKELKEVIPDIAGLLRHINPTIRADAAYLLGIIGHKDALPYLMQTANDTHASVKEVISDTINELSSL